MAVKTTHGPVRAALEKTLASDVRLRSDKHAALAALCRLTADQVDQAGGQVSTRLIASYLSALKDVERVMAGRAPGTQGDDRGVGDGGTLGSLRALAGGKVS